MPGIGVVADDLTGAMTAGVLLARSKAKTAVFFDEDSIGGAAGFDAVLVSTGSRAMSSKDAYEAVRKATVELKEWGAEYYSKRIDTTMRGRIGTEIDAMLDVLGEDTIAVIVPAMPQSRRILVGGFSIIDGKALSETAVAQDVKTPVRESFVPGILSEQSRRKIGQVLLRSIQKGTEETIRAFTESRSSGAQLIVADAVTLEHIRTITDVVLRLGWNVLAVDPGPFTQMINLERGLLQEESDNCPPISSEAGTKTALVIAGSATYVTEKQIKELCKDERHHLISVDPVRLTEGGEAAETEISKALDSASRLWDSGCPRAVIFETALHGTRLDLGASDALHHYSAGTSSQLLNTGLGRIAKGVLDRAGQERIAGVYATGGDTLEAVCRQLGAAYLEMLDYVIPQTDIGRSCGSCHGLPIIGKGGMTGNDRTALDIVTRLFQENGRPEPDFIHK